MPFDDAIWPIIKATDTTDAAATALLIGARGFLERGWCRWVFARDAEGRPVEPDDDQAVAWCANGALMAAGMTWNEANEYLANPVVQRLEAAIGDDDIANFNNCQETVEPILAAFDRAIAAGSEG